MMKPFSLLLPVWASAALVMAAGAKGNTDLHQAALTGTSGDVRQWLERGADAKQANALGITPLHYAATEPAKIRLLLAAGADANAVSAQGRTPLLIAAAAGCFECVKLLEAQGADVHARDKSGSNAVVMAAVNNHEALVRYFLEKKVDAKAADAQGFTALHWAAAQSSPELVRLLIAKGAMVDASNTVGQKVPRGEVALKGLTPLMLAAPYRPASVVKALLDAGADPNRQDVRGMTALMLAVSSENQDAAVVKLLLARGARVDIQSKAGETALAWARKFNDGAVLAAFGAKPVAPPVEKRPPFFVPPSSRTAVDKAMGLLEASSQTFFKEGGCFACHHSVMTAVAQASAASHGHAINAQVAGSFKQGANQFFGSFQPVLAQLMDPPGGSDTVTYMLFGMAAAQIAPNATTDAMAIYLARTQKPDGTWTVPGVPRSPIEESAIHRAALAYYVIDRYLPTGLAAEKAERLARARRVLERTAVKTSDDASMKLAGLVWAKAPRPMIDAAAREVVRRQRADGGWSGTPRLASDAYSTAVAVFALREAATEKLAVERGAVYLLATQKDDGSWFAKSRSPKFQPEFESGFPHGPDQWLSASATAWAVRALAGLEPKLPAGATASAY